MSLIQAVLAWFILTAVVAAFLRRIRLAPGLVVSLSLAVLAWQLWHMPLQSPVSWWGLMIDPQADMQFLRFRFLLTASARTPVLLLVFWGSLLALAGGLARADRVLFPAIPLTLTALLLALTATPLLWAPFWLVIAVMIMALPAQGVHPRPARGALRILVAPVLALPFFVYAAWVLTQSSGDSNAISLQGTAWQALVIGIGLLLTPVPLHGWVISLGEDAPPFAAVWIVGAWQITVYMLVRRVLLLYPTVADVVDPGTVLPWLAMIQMGWAALFAFGSQRVGQFWGYLLLWDVGATYLLWGMTGELGAQSILWLLLARPLVLALVASGLRMLREHFGFDGSYGSLSGAGQHLPWAAGAILIGALFVVGWPAGALFPMRVLTLQLAQVQQARLFLGLMLASFLMILAVVRLQQALFASSQQRHVPKEKRVLWLLAPLFILNLLLSLHPGLIEGITLRLSDWLTRLG